MNPAKIFSPFLLMGMRIFSGIVYLITILAAFGGSIDPDYFTFPSLLCLITPYLAILCIILIIFWAFCKKIIFCGLGILTIVICMAPLSVAFPLSMSKSPKEGSETFKIISWNVIHTRDIRQPDKPGIRAARFMIDSKADIICLAELVSFDEPEIRGLPESLHDSLFSIYPYRAGLGSRDIKIMSKYPVERVPELSEDVEGTCRFDFFKVSFPQKHDLVVGMVHLYSYGLSEEERNVVTEINSVETAKNSMEEFKGSIRQKLRAAFRKRGEDAAVLRKEIDKISKKVPLIVCGDFNDVPASWTYKIIKGDDLKDAYAETNFGPAITYNLHAFYFHIDQMLYRGPLKALDLKVDKFNSSDHYPLVADFEFTNP